MKQPVRVLSDLHLGHKLSRIEHVSTLRPLIAGAGTVIFNGDTWQELAGPFHELGATMLAELKSLCAEEGVETVYLSGNHDPDWPGSGWVELAGGRIIITHGDALFDAGSPWKREILTAQDRVLEIWRSHSDASWDIDQRIEVVREIARVLCSVEYPLGRHIFKRAWDAATPPLRALKMLEAWFTQGGAGAHFCENYFPNAEALIIGHLHYQGCWEKKGRLVINTGSFLDPGRAHYVEWNNGLLIRGEIDERPDECRLGQRLGVWRF
jgi:predicted phosphodiesterase